jgi:hypothetical protein
MIAELAMGGLSYQQIGRKCGKTDNNRPAICLVLQEEIAEERARSYAELRLRCNGEKQYRVKVLKEIIEEMNERWSSSLRSVITGIPVPRGPGRVE